MEWFYHHLIEDKCQYPCKKERNKFEKKCCVFFYCFLLQIHTHENVLALKSTNKVD
jgi:hypothetical protein